MIHTMAQATYPQSPRAGSSIAYLVLLPVEIARFTRPEHRLVSVALIRALRQAAVSCYGALWSPDFPREPKGSRDHRGELYPSGDCTKFQTFSPFDIQKNTPNCYIRQTAQRLSKLFDFYKKNNKLSLLIERLEISLTVHRQQPLSTL